MKTKSVFTEINFQPFSENGGGFPLIGHCIWSLSSPIGSIGSIKTLYESIGLYEVGIHTPDGVSCEIPQSCQYRMNTHAFAISSLKKREKENLINRKVVTKWELSKTEVFWRIYHYSGRKTIKTDNKQTLFWKMNVSFTIFDQ